jgi:hypothetical protein
VSNRYHSVKASCKWTRHRLPLLSCRGGRIKLRGHADDQDLHDLSSQIWADAPMLEPVRQSLRTDRSIAWIRVHDLPDFVYFNHSIHLAKGIGCVSCHGQVNQMPLMWREHSLDMEWCLECHRQPERFVRPRELVFSMRWEAPEDQLMLGRRLTQEYDLEKPTSCSVCHR